jgi:hypothetical protein
MKSRRFLAILPLVAVVAFFGCDKKSASSKNTDKGAKVTRVAATEWCAEHGVPEADCTRCHSNLIAAFKQKGDWCDKHNLPKSQCTECDPSLKAKFEAMAPKE